MKKNNKILILGLGLSLAFAPINSLVSSNINVAYAVGENTGEEELTLEEYIDQAKKFIDSDDFKEFDEKDQENYKELLQALSDENLEQENIDKIVKEIEKIKLSYIENEYQVLKKNVLSLKDNSLPKELQTKLSEYKDSYDTYEEYSSKIEELKHDKENIEIEKNKIKELKDILKKGLDDNKNSGVDFKDEEAIYNKKDASYDEVNNAINSLNEKVEAHNAEVEEKNRQANLKTLKEIIDQEKEIKKAIYYKKSSKNLKDKFNQSLESIKSAYNKIYNKEKVNNVDALVNAYNLAYKNLDGNEFENKYNELKQYFEKNKNKLSKENQEKFAESINELPDKEDSNLESIKKLKAEINNAFKSDPTPPTPSRIAVKKQPATKKSRSFVRTGVKSVGIVLVVLILAAISYFFATKKSKNNK